MRCTHEAQMHQHNCFITLTYDQKHLPKNGSLNKKHFQDFMKRLRKKIGIKIRYYHSGEYGEKFRRPHYHACLFGYAFPDKTVWKSNGTNTLYVSRELNEVWPFGFSSIGNFDFNTAAYVARYTLKKVYGKAGASHYLQTNPTTGEVTELTPEYSTMSRRPGIGASWLKKFQSDVYPKGRVVLRGKEMKPPKFYDKLFEEASPSQFESIQFDRQQAAKNSLDNSPERLKTRLAVLQHSLKQLKRSYES